MTTDTVAGFVRIEDIGRFQKKSPLVVTWDESANLPRVYGPQAPTKGHTITEIGTSHCAALQQFVKPRGPYSPN
uniref:hypothetical protein n=1 Tax=Staphylococcus aureus TaxID=1280 RepID=UPI0034D96BF4